MMSAAPKSACMKMTGTFMQMALFGVRYEVFHTKEDAERETPLKFFVLFIQIAGLGLLPKGEGFILINTQHSHLLSDFLIPWDPPGAHPIPWPG